MVAGAAAAFVAGLAARGVFMRVAGSASYAPLAALPGDVRGRRARRRRRPSLTPFALASPDDAPYSDGWVGARGSAENPVTSSTLPPPAPSREPNGWTERTSARLVEDVRALLRVDAVAFVTVDEERGQLTRAAGWFASPELSEALQPLEARPLTRGRRGLVEAALERARPLLLPRVEAWEAAPDLLAELVDVLGEERAHHVWGTFSAASVIAWRLRNTVGQPLGVILLASLDPVRAARHRRPPERRGGGRPHGDGHGAGRAARGGGQARPPRAAAQARRRGRGGLARARRGAPPGGRPRRQRDRGEQGPPDQARLARRGAAGGGQRGLHARRRRGTPLARGRRRGQRGPHAHRGAAAAAARRTGRTAG